MNYHSYDDGHGDPVLFRQPPAGEWGNWALALLMLLTLPLWSR